MEDAIVRPGVQVLSASCTANFLFRSPDNRSLYLGTAAHCLRGMSENDTVEIAGGAATGTAAFIGSDKLHINNLSKDFALIEISPEDRHLVHPAMMHYGGPTASANGTTVGDKVYTYGNTRYRDNAGTLDPREGVVVDGNPEGQLGAYFVPASVPGDSGSPVVTRSGAALGWVSTVNFAVMPQSPSANSLPSAGSNGLGYLPWALQFVRDEADLDPQLVTWDSFDPSGAFPTVTAR